MDPTEASVGILGAGAVGLITAHTLLKDGFSRVQVLTRDATVGGTWATARVSPDIFLNNLYGEYQFTPLDLPMGRDTPDRRLRGADIRLYMETFAERFLKDRIRYNTEITRIRRSSDEAKGKWVVSVQSTLTDAREELHFDKIVLCTGECSEPKIPKELSPDAATSASFDGPVLHSSLFQSRLDDVLASVRPVTDEKPGSVALVGGHKSAQDTAVYLAGQGRKVTIVMGKPESFLAAPHPLPDFLRKSRLMGVMVPHNVLRTRLERFLHKTYLGSAIVHRYWKFLQNSSYDVFDIPKGSPLRDGDPLFWSWRLNDEGVFRDNHFFNLVKLGKIEIIAPDRVVSFGKDGRSVVLQNGRNVLADAVILCTGYESSWDKIMDRTTMDDIGLSRHPLTQTAQEKIHEWDDYRSLANPPHVRPETQQAPSLYRGIIPAKNIEHRDFAVNGAVLTAGNGYVWEVSAHWISSYFLGDKFLHVPSAEKALELTERDAVWLRKRYPDAQLWVNCSKIEFFTWHQFVDELLEDMELPGMRSGGNWLTWVFKTVRLDAIATLHEERKEKRAAQL